MMKKQLWNSHYGNKKGFVFTLDSLIAVVISFIVLGAASGYVAKSTTSLADMQISRTGSDIVTLLENTNSFDSLNFAAIESSLNQVLPEKYGLRINLQCSDSDLNEVADFIIGEDIPENNFVSSGKRFFVIENSEIDYCMINYWVWKK